MLSFLTQIVDTILMIVNLVVMVIKSVVQFILMLPTWTAYASAAVVLVPSVFTPFLILGIVLTIVWVLIQVI